MFACPRFTQVRAHDLPACCPCCPQLPGYSGLEFCRGGWHPAWIAHPLKTLPSFLRASGFAKSPRRPLWANTIAMHPRMTKKLLNIRWAICPMPLRMPPQAQGMEPKALPSTKARYKVNTVMRASDIRRPHSRSVGTRRSTTMLSSTNGMAQKRTSANPSGNGCLCISARLCAQLMSLVLPA